MKSYKYQITVGLFDKTTEKQEITDELAEKYLKYVLIHKYGIYAFTMIRCAGVYRMESTSNIVSEPSIMVEIISESKIENMVDIVNEIRLVLNQESVMLEQSVADVDFIAK